MERKLLQFSGKCFIWHLKAPFGLKIWERETEIVMTSIKDLKSTHFLVYISIPKLRIYVFLHEMDNQQSVEIQKSQTLISDTVSWFGVIYSFLFWRRKWQSTPVFLPGKSHRQRSLVGATVRGISESDTSWQLNHHHQQHSFICY